VITIADGAAIEPLPATGPKELRQLSMAVNRLAERLHQLEELRRRAFANIVHELGRPLGAVRSAIHALRQSAGDDRAIREELLAGVEDEIVRMQPLLDDLTQLHAQVLGTPLLARRPVALGDWLVSLAVPWRAAALAKGLDWQTTVAPNLPMVDIDPDRLARAVGNLCSNAIKYTPPGGTVMLSAGVSERDIWIAVADTGPGIAAEERERVFEPFYRSVQQRRFPQGLGLGLTIARELVVAHGGAITLTSVPGQGSRFTIHLPVSIDVSSSSQHDGQQAPDAAGKRV
jgi:signal transduction histidine kinase